MNTVQEIRHAIACGAWRKPTAGLAPGFIQANLVILPKQHAFDFLLFCQRNDKACPVVDVCESGCFAPPLAGPTADVRVHVPRYRIYRQGKLSAEPDNILKYFDDTMVSFFLGCSFTFEHDLLTHHIPVRHIELSRNVPMYITNRECHPAGVFAGPMVVSMRPIPENQIDAAISLTAKHPKAHGAPVQIGDPESLGIRDIQRPDFGDPPDIRPGEQPLFWACGVTPQAAIVRAKLDLVITHAPGYMFITDIPNHS